jgi:PAS domain S-box-containing protein
MTGATERITGYTTEEIIALQCWGKLVIDEDLPLFKKHISSLEPGNASSCELRLRHKNGGIVWVASYSECSREEDEQGDIYLYGALVDITNRKEAEGILTDIINKNPISIQILDENGYTLQVNPANEALFGVVPPPHFNIFDALIQKDPELGKLISLARSGQVVNFPDDNFNVKDIHPENPYAPVWIKTVLFPLKDKDGKPIRFVFMHENITDRRKAEETIRESQASLEEAQIIAKTGNWDYDLKTKKVTWSKNYYRMIGLEPGEVNPTYELFTSHVHPDDLHLVSDASKSNFRSKEAVTLELRFILADGSIKWFQNKSVPFFENNVLVKMKGVITDITERKQAEEKLKVSENKYRYLVENALVGIYTTTIDGNLIYANEALRKMMEFDSVDEFIDFGVKSTYKNTDERDIFVRNIIDSRQVLNRELELVTKKGKTINVIVSSFVSGEVIIGMMMDITERKEAEEVIKASEENYHKLYNLVRLMSDTMPDMIWAKDLEKKFIFVNKSLCDNLLIAKNTNEPIGKTDLYFAERERKAHTENPDWHTFGKLCMDSDTVTLEEMKEMQFDEFGNVKGKYLFLDVHKAPLHNVNGELIGVVGSARDITLRKQAQEILQQKMTELQRFYDVTVDRELFMIELKKEVNDLMKKAGLGEKYKIVK